MALNGQIHAHMMGQKVSGCYKDGTHLIIEAEDGHRYKIGWVDDNGQTIKGEPVLVNLGCVIRLPAVSFDGLAGQL